jgi:hypothetical protein
VLTVILEDFLVICLSLHLSKCLFFLLSIFLSVFLSVYRAIFFCQYISAFQCPMEKKHFMIKYLLDANNFSVKELSKDHIDTIRYIMNSLPSLLCCLCYSEQTAAFVACAGSLLSIGVVWAFVPQRTKKTQVKGNLQSLMTYKYRQQKWTGIKVS